MSDTKNTVAEQLVQMLKMDRIGAESCEHTESEGAVDRVTDALTNEPWLLSVVDKPHQKQKQKDLAYDLHLLVIEYGPYVMETRKMIAALAEQLSDHVYEQLRT